MPSVAVIDMSLPVETAAAHLRKACTSDGFFYAANHGVAQQLVDEHFKQQRLFFSQPLDFKIQIELVGKDNRGYTPFQTDSLDPTSSTQHDTREGLYFGRDVDPTSDEARLPLHGPNKWPDPAVLPDYRRVVEEYYAAMMKLGNRIVELLAVALELPAKHFEQFFTRPMAFLRPLRYEPQLSKPNEGVFGAGAHSDWGMVTILAVEDPGLQIWRDGAWVDVDPLEGTFVVNLGDMLERWSNGLFKATVHRVVSVTGRDRYSVPFFLDPNFDAYVECLPTCRGQEGPKYKPTTAGQHLLDKYAETREDGLDISAAPVEVLTVV